MTAPGPPNTNETLSAAGALTWPCGCVMGKTPHGAGWSDCEWRDKPCVFPVCVEGEQPPYCGNCGGREKENP